MTTQKTGVIVARMQTPYLTEGHVDLIKHVANACESIVLVLGESQAKLTDKNPFTYDMRVSMIRNLYPFMLFERIDDHPSDEEWSKNLDDILVKYKNPHLFGSRDSFIKDYTGSFPTVLYEQKIEISATEIRKQIASIHPSNLNKDIRTGIVYAVENRYPIVYPVVDIAILNGTGRFLLGRKAGHKHLCFIGGFVDPSDPSLIHAAFRELTEEVKNVKVIVPLEQIASHKIDDWRYKGTKDSLMSTLFVTVIEEAGIEAADDIEQLMWADLEDFDLNLLQPCHHILFNSLKKYLNA